MIFYLFIYLLLLLTRIGHNQIIILCHVYRLLILIWTHPITLLINSLDTPFSLLACIEWNQFDDQ